MITRTSIIVLKTVNFSESSLIATVFSKEHGKISVIAKGAKKPGSQFGGLVQPGMLLSAIYYFKPTRGVQTLTEASCLVRLPTLVSDIEKMAITMSLLELISQVIHEGEINDSVYNFTENFLIWLNDQQEVAASVFPYVQVRLADLLGFGLQTGIDVEEGQHYFNIDLGTISADSASNQAVPLSANQLHFLYYAITTRKVKVLEMTLTRNELKELIHHLDVYFRYHLEGIKPRRSDAIFDQLLSK